MSDVRKALDAAAGAVLDQFFGGSSGLDEMAEAIARDQAHATVLAFLRAMPDTFSQKRGEETKYLMPLVDQIDWTPSRLAAAIEKETGG